MWWYSTGYEGTTAPTESPTSSTTSTTTNTKGGDKKKKKGSAGAAVAIVIIVILLSLAVMSLFLLLKNERRRFVCSMYSTSGFTLYFSFVFTNSLFHVLRYCVLLSYNRNMVFEKTQWIFGQPSKPPISIDAEMVTKHYVCCNVWGHKSVWSLDEARSLYSVS